MRNIVESKIFDGSQVTTGGSGEVDLAAKDSTDIKAIAGAISGAAAGGGIGAVIGTVGASVAVNDIENSVRSFISGSTVTSDASIALEAISNSSILSVTVAGAGGERIVLLPYNSAASAKYHWINRPFDLTGLKRQDESKMEKLAAICRDSGLETEIVG